MVTEMIDQTVIQRFRPRGSSSVTLSQVTAVFAQYNTEVTSDGQLQHCEGISGLYQTKTFVVEMPHGLAHL